MNAPSSGRGRPPYSDRRVPHAALAAHRLLLRLWPSAFRAELGQAMTETFDDQLRSARAAGRLAAATFLARALATTAAHGLVERLARRPAPSPRPERHAMFYWQDVRYALRLLAKTPLFTALTIVVLAGGLGLSIFTWSFLHTAMLKPLPVPEGDRIVRLLVAPGSGAGIDAANLAAMRPGITTLTDVGAYTSRAVVVGDGERTRSIEATAAEWNVFEATRIRAALGRTFQPRDQEPGAEPVIVLGWHTWRAVFGGDSSLVDRMVRLNGTPTRVIGVMPEGYGFPVASDAWTPIRPDLLTQQTPDQEDVLVYARLAPGVSRARAEAELSALLVRARDGQVTRPGRVAPTGVVLETFPMAQIGDGAPLVLTVLNTLAGLILLLACINVTNLLLARANERARETAVRLALGAPRGRLVMQSMWESVLLCVAGGALATVGATWGLRGINAWANANLEGNLAFWWVWGFDRTVVLSAGAFVTLAIAVLGGVMARRAARTAITTVLQEGLARAGSRAEGRVARALVVTQVATVSVLMFFGAMSAIVARRVATVDLGYETRNLLSGAVALPDERYRDADARARFFGELTDRLSGRPALEGGIVLRAGLADLASEGGVVEVAGRAPGSAPARAYVMAASGPLTTMGITLSEGRFLDARDAAAAEPTALVSAAFAARTWPGGSPIGRQVRVAAAGDSTRWRTVVGVVGDVLLGNPISRDRSPLAVYVPLAQAGGSRASVLFRHRGDRQAAQAEFTRTVAELDPRLTTDPVMSFDEVLAKTTLMADGVTKLFAACFGFALLLAVSGTYGLMARSITRRTRELGVRRALGATDRAILLMLLGQGGRQLGVGALAALPLTLLVGVGFSHYFPIATALSVTTALLVSAAITAVVLAATWLPTRRAVAIEPRDALWRE